MSCTCEPGVQLRQPHAPWLCQMAEGDWDATDCTCGHVWIDPACVDHGHLIAADECPDCGSVTIAHATDCPVIAA